MGAKNIYDKLMSEFKNAYGVCGLMGNLFAESGLKTTNLQNTFEKKLGMTDEQYTKAVDNGSYDNFVKDSAGYGLAQWTYWSRKQSLLNYAKQRNCSIGDGDMQVDFLIDELKTNFKSVYNALKNATSVREASDLVLTQFEKPKNQGESVKIKRAQYGQKYFDQYAQKKEETNMKYSRQAVVDLIESWVGKNEKDGSFKMIIDIYNSLPVSQLPRRTKMQYSWAWCAVTWSALAIKLGYTAIMPIEMSCYYLIEKAKEMGIWKENDNYIPEVADAILYDWDDTGSGENTGDPEHIGVVTFVNESEGYMIVTEGNYGEAVKKRTIALRGRYIRGYITPKYTDNTVSAPVQTPNKDITTIAREVIAGKWGTGTARKNALEAKGYDYNAVQKKVNEILNGSAVTPSTPTQSQEQPVAKKVTATCSAKCKDAKIAGTYKTTANLYMRNDAGTNKKALVKIPKGTPVKCYGYYNVANGVKWYYIQCTIDRVQYTGFSSSAYLKRV